MRIYDRLLIGGRWVKPHGLGSYELYSPVTEEPIGRIPQPSKIDADAAVSAARKAFDEGPWPHVAIEDRVSCLRAVADGLEARADELSRLCSEEQGLPIAQSPFLVHATVELWRDVARRLETFSFEHGIDEPGFSGRVIRQPIGVALAITAWNSPLSLAAQKLAPGLGAGCTMVWKPSQEVSLCTFVMAEILAEAGFPEGVVSVIPGDRELGQQLVDHAGIDKIGFTGSTAAGRAIMASAANRIARVSLELGGKSAALLCDDIGPERVIPALLAGGLMMTGQNCSATSRVLVPARRQTDYIEALSEAMSSMAVGDPLDSATELGPLTLARQRASVEDFITAGIDEGARLVTGGRRPLAISRGWFLEPTLFADVRNDMRIAREEIFGPVISVIAYGNPEEAIRLANDSPYGLVASVYSEDPELAQQTASKIRAGQVNVNGYGICLTESFGGFKQSGLGREGGLEGISGYLETQLINSAPMVPLVGAATA